MVLETSRKPLGIQHKILHLAPNIKLLPVIEVFDRSLSLEYLEVASLLAKEIGRVQIRAPVVPGDSREVSTEIGVFKFGCTLQKVTIKS
jgi:hypothetical protein